MLQANSTPCCCAHSLPVQPAGSGAPRNDGQALAGAQRRRGLARDVGGGVAALIVDQDDVERARIVLPQQRADGLADGFGLVARRDDGGHRRPARQLRCRRQAASSRSAARQNPPRAAIR